MDPHPAYTASYLEDIFIHRDTWVQDVQQLAAVLLSLRYIGLTATLKRCAAGQRKVRYHGNHSGCGQEQSQQEKTTVIAACS